MRKGREPDKEAEKIAFWTAVGGLAMFAFALGLLAAGVDFLIAAFVAGWAISALVEALVRSIRSRPR